MRYFVVHPDGSQYGPADLALLTQWVSEGRLIASTPLVEEGSGRQLQAAQVPWLTFPGAGSPSNYPVQNVGQGQSQSLGQTPFSSPYSGNSQPYGQQPYNQPQYGQQPYGQPLQAGGADGSSASNWSYICSGVAIFLPCLCSVAAPLSLVLGFVGIALAIVGGRQSGRSPAAGIVFGVIAITVGLTVIILSNSLRNTPMGG